jgi:glycosidase
MNRFLWAVRGDARKLRLAAVCQFSLPQPPIIYYGTEVGLSQEEDVAEWGFEACRLPMLWDGREDPELLRFYRILIRARHAHPSLRFGRRRILLLDGDGYAFACEDGEDVTVVAINNSGLTRRVSLPDVTGTDIFTGMAIKGGCTLGPWQAILVEQ